MYQALYRKYRPSTFDEVVGQDVIIRTLENEITHNKLSHAYLFTGPRGTGKTSIAKIFAKTVNCIDLNGFLPCNECVSCTQINNKQTTDIIEIDAASNNGVDEIRELKSKVNLVPSSSKYKVYIIDEVHMLTVGAFNALLKTLEEPPSHIIFILATTDPHKIPSTILSRCQRFDFKKISENKIVERLTTIVKNEQIDIEENALYEIARLSDGGMRDSISMLDQVISYAEEGKTITIKEVHDVNGTLSQVDIKHLIENLLNKNISNIFHSIDECNDGGKNLIKLTEEIILFLRNLLLCKTVPNYFKDNNVNIQLYEDLKDNVSIDHLLVMIKEFTLAINDMKNTNNPKIILELAIIKQMEIPPNENNVKSTQMEIVQEIPRKQEPLVSSVSISEERISQKEIPVNLTEPIVSMEVPKPKTVEKYFPGKVFNENKRAELKQVKQIRINNALAGFNKKDLLAFKKNEEILHTYLLDSDCSEYISMMLDGVLKAVGNDYLIYVYPTERLSDIFNESLINIETTLEKVFEKKYHAISTYESDWEQIKKEFNNKIKTFTYQEETIQLEDLFQSKEKEENELESLFGNIVEYQ